MMKNATRRQKSFCGLAGLIFFVLFASVGYAQTTGKIAGVVTDASNGEGLVGVNVIVEGTTLGAGTDSEGRYFILNVPPGTYTVRTSFIGYKIILRNNVKVSVGQTTEQDFSLETTVIEGEEVIVSAERPLVEKDLTVSVSKYDANELQNRLPVAKVTEILETSPSFYRGFIRGGSKHETKTLVDGVEVSDTYFSAGQGSYGRDPGHPYQNNRPTDDSDNAGLTVSAGALQEISVFAGTFNAEYPAATAGIVNTVTREGGRNFSFSLFNKTQASSRKSHQGTNIYHDADLYFGERDTYLASADPNLQARGSLFTWSPQKALDNYNYDPETGESLSRSHETSLTLSGPLSSKGSFFFSGHYNNDVSPLPFEESKHIGGSLKLAYNLTPSKKLTGMFQLNDGGELFNFSNGKFNPRYKYFMEGAPRYKDQSSLGYLKYTQAVSANTFFEIQASSTNIISAHGYSDDNGNGVVEIGEEGDFIDFDTLDEYIYYVGGTATADGNGFDPNDPNRRVFFSATINPGDAWQPRINQNEYVFNGYNVNGNYLTSYPQVLYNRYERSKFTIKGDITSQVNFNNQIKAGISYTRHNVNVNSLQSELGGAGNTYPTSKFHVNFLDFQPQELAAYIQDKVEYEGLIFNIGLRVDGFNNDTQSFINDFNPTRVVRDADNQIEVINVLRGDNVGFNFFLSPRIGVSHPVTNNFAMHYSFGRFFQYPNYSTLYTDYNFTDYAQPTNFTVRPDQDPVRSINYEIGGQYAIGNSLLLTGTAYYRDVQNTQRATYTVSTGDGAPINLSTTWGYSDARGVELELSKRPGRWWGGRISYAFSYIKIAGGAGASDVRTSYIAADSSGYTELPWDELNRASSRERNVLVNQDATNIISGGYDRPHRINGTLQLFLPADINATFLGEWSSGFYYQLSENDTDPFFDRGQNLEVGPSTFFVNGRISKLFRINNFGFELFGEVRNLFNRTNIRSISPGRDQSNDRQIWESGRVDTQTGAQLTQPETDPEGDFKLPTDRFGRLFYLNAREWYFGINFNFR